MSENERLRAAEDERIYKADSLYKNDSRHSKKKKK